MLPIPVVVIPPANLFYHTRGSHERFSKFLPKYGNSLSLGLTFYLIYMRIRIFWSKIENGQKSNRGYLISNIITYILFSAKISDFCPKRTPNFEI